MMGLSQLSWQFDTNFQTMTAPSARVTLPPSAGTTEIELGVLYAADTASLGALRLFVNGVEVVLTRWSFMQREVFSGEVTLDGATGTEIEVRVPALTEAEAELFGLALDWIVLHPHK